MGAVVQAENTPVASGSTSADSTKPRIEVGFVLIEINEKAYQQQSHAIDEAVKNGDIPYLIHLQGVSVVSSPNVTTPVGLKAEISMEKEFIWRDKPVPTTTLTATSALNANGTISPVVVRSEAVELPKALLGIDFNTTPSLSDNGTILLPFRYRLGEVVRYKDKSDFDTRTTINAPEKVSLINLRALDGKAYGYWIGQTQPHAYSLFDILESTSNSDKTLPPLSPSPNRLAFFLTAHQLAE